MTRLPCRSGRHVDWKLGICYAPNSERKGTKMTLNFESEFGLEAEAMMPTLESELPSSAQLRARIQRHRSAYAKLMKAVAAMRPHVAERNGSLHFALPARSMHEAAAKLAIDPGLFTHLLKALNARKLVASRLGLGRARLPLPVTTAREWEWESEVSCAGVTQTENPWWGIKLWLDECKTKALVNWLQGGGAATGAACTAAVPEAAPACAVIGALGPAEGFFIAGVDDSGGDQGVILSFTWANLAAALLPPPLNLAAVMPIVVSQSSA